MAGKIRGITIELSADATGVLDAISKVNSKIKSTATELKDVDRLLKLDPSNTQLLTQKSQLLKEQISQVKDKLDALKQAQADMDANGVDKNSEQYRALQREIAAAEQELKRLEQTAGSGSAALAKISAVTGNIGEKMESAGKKMSILSGGIAAGFTAAAKTAIDFETAFAGVQKTVDGTPEQLDSIKQGIIDLSERTASSATDIAAVAEAAGQLGIATDDVLDFTETMVMLGDTTNLSADEAASALAKFANITGTSADDYSRLGSTIVDLGNNFATTESDIVAMASNLASAGTLVGLTEPEILALATAMSSVGIEAAAGGTAMSQTFTAIEKAVAASGDDLKKIAEIAGMSAEDFASAWNNNPVKAIEGFITGIGKLDEQGESATLVLDELGMSGIRQSNMLKALALASDTLSGAIGTATGAWEENTALSDEASKKYETTEAKIHQLKATLTEIGIQIGEILIPIITDVVNWVKNAFESFSELDEGTKKIIVTIAAIVAAIGPLLVVGGKVMKGISSITGALSKMGGAAAGPIGLVVAGVAALVAAGVALAESWKAAYKESSPFTEALEDLKQRNEDLATSIGNTKSAYDTSVEASEASAFAAKTMYEKLQDLIAGYDGTAESAAAIEGVVSQLNELVPGLGLSWDSVTNSLNKTNTEIYNNIEAMRAQAQVAALQDMYTESLKEQYQAQKNVSDAAKTLNGLLDKYGITTREFFSIWDEGKNSGVELVKLMNEHGVALLDQTLYAEELSIATQELNEARKNQEEVDANVLFAEEQLGEAMTNAAKATASASDTIAKKYEEVFGTQIPAQLQNAITQAENAGVQIPQSIVDGILNGSISVEDAAKQIAALTDQQTVATENGIKTGAAYAEATATSVIDEAPTVQAAAETATAELDTSTEAYNYGQEAGSSFDAGLASQETTVTGTASQIAGDVVDQFSDTPAEMNAAGSSAGSNMQQGINSQASNIQFVLQRIAGLFGSELKGIGVVLQQLGVGAMAKFGSSIATGTTTSVLPVMQACISAIQSGFGSLQGIMYGVGSNAGSGLYNGLWGWSATLSNLAWSMASNIANAARAALRIKSPSRVMEQIGEFTGEGLMEGLDQTASGIYQTASQIAEGTAEALSPNLDGMQALNNSTSVSAGRLSGDMTGANVSGIVSLLAQYLPYLAEGGTIVLDDGTLVGRMAPAMNEALQRIAVKSDRG